MDRLQEMSGLHGLTGFEDVLHEDVSPAGAVARHALFGPAETSPSTSIVALMRANVQMGGGYAA